MLVAKYLRNQFSCGSYCDQIERVDAGEEWEVQEGTVHASVFSTSDIEGSLELEGKWATGVRTSMGVFSSDRPETRRTGDNPWERIPLHSWGDPRHPYDLADETGDRIVPLKFRGSRTSLQGRKLTIEFSIQLIAHSPRGHVQHVSLPAVATVPLRDVTGTFAHPISAPIWMDLKCVNDPLSRHGWDLRSRLETRSLFHVPFTGERPEGMWTVVGWLRGYICWHVAGNRLVDLFTQPLGVGGSLPSEVDPATLEGENAAVFDVHSSELNMTPHDMFDAGALQAAANGANGPKGTNRPTWTAQALATRPWEAGEPMQFSTTPSALAVKLQDFLKSNPQLRVMVHSLTGLQPRGSSAEPEQRNTLFTVFRWACQRATIPIRMRFSSTKEVSFKADSPVWFSVGKIPGVGGAWTLTNWRAQFALTAAWELLRLLRVEVWDAPSVVGSAAGPADGDEEEDSDDDVEQDIVESGLLHPSELLARGSVGINPGRINPAKERQREDPSDPNVRARRRAEAYCGPFARLCMGGSNSKSATEQRYSPRLMLRIPLLPAAAATVRTADQGQLDISVQLVGSRRPEPRPESEEIGPEGPPEFERVWTMPDKYALTDPSNTAEQNMLRPVSAMHLFGGPWSVLKRPGQLPLSKFVEGMKDTGWSLWLPMRMRGCCGGDMEKDRVELGEAVNWKPLPIPSDDSWDAWLAPHSHLARGAFRAAATSAFGHPSLLEDPSADRDHVEEPPEEVVEEPPPVPLLDDEDKDGASWGIDDRESLSVDSGDDESSSSSEEAAATADNAANEGHRGASGLEAIPGQDAAVADADIELPALRQDGYRGGAEPTGVGGVFGDAEPAAAGTLELAENTEPSANRFFAPPWWEYLGDMIDRRAPFGWQTDSVAGPSSRDFLDATHPLLQAANCEGVARPLCSWITPWPLSDRLLVNPEGTAQELVSLDVPLKYHMRKALKQSRGVRMASTPQPEKRRSRPRGALAAAEAPPDGGSVVNGPGESEAASVQHRGGTASYAGSVLDAVDNASQAASKGREDETNKDASKSKTESKKGGEAAEKEKKAALRREETEEPLLDPFPHMCWRVAQLVGSVPFEMHAVTEATFRNMQVGSQALLDVASSRIQRLDENREHLRGDPWAAVRGTQSWRAMGRTLRQVRTLWPSMWRPVDAVVNDGKGSVVDHALLLCSLLRGMGQAAFVCVGLAKRMERPPDEPEEEEAAAADGEAREPAAARLGGGSESDPAAHPGGDDGAWDIWSDDGVGETGAEAPSKTPAGHDGARRGSSSDVDGEEEEEEESDDEEWDSDPAMAGGGGRRARRRGPAGAGALFSVSRTARQGHGGAGDDAPDELPGPDADGAVPLRQSGPVARPHRGAYPGQSSQARDGMVPTPSPMGATESGMRLQTPDVADDNSEECLHFWVAVYPKKEELERKLHRPHDLERSFRQYQSKAPHPPPRGLYDSLGDRDMYSWGSFSKRRLHARRTNNDGVATGDDKAAVDWEATPDFWDVNGSVAPGRYGCPTNMSEGLIQEVLQPSQYRLWKRACKYRQRFRRIFCMFNDSNIWVNLQRETPARQAAFGELVDKRKKNHERLCQWEEEASRFELQDPRQRDAEAQGRLDIAWRYLQSADRERLLAEDSFRELTDPVDHRIDSADQLLPSLCDHTTFHPFRSNCWYPVMPLNPEDFPKRERTAAEKIIFGDAPDESQPSGPPTPMQLPFPRYVPPAGMPLVLRREPSVLERDKWLNETQQVLEDGIAMQRASQGLSQGVVRSKKRFEQLRRKSKAFLLLRMWADAWEPGTPERAYLDMELEKARVNLVQSIEGKRKKSARSAQSQQARVECVWQVWSTSMSAPLDVQRIVLRSLRGGSETSLTNASPMLTSREMELIITVVLEPSFTGLMRTRVSIVGRHVTT